MTQTKAGRDPEEALDQIAAQAQGRSTCPVCGGEGSLQGRQLGRESTTWIECPKCEGPGTVPAGPQAELAAWHKELVRLIEGAAEWLLSTSFQDHLAAMPQAQPDAELLKALKRLDAEIEDISGNADACVFCGDATGDLHSKGCPITQARAAIALAETGAPA